jgi:hypothetical protein
VQADIEAQYIGIVAMVVKDMLDGELGKGPRTLPRKWMRNGPDRLNRLTDEQLGRGEAVATFATMAARV